MFLLQYLKSNNYRQLVFSIVLFGFGVGFRWINGFYLFVLFGDFILNDDSKTKYFILIERVKKSIYIFPFYILSIIFFIQISGYSIIDIFNTYISGVGYIKDKEISYLSLGATAISFLTPSIIVLCFLGILYAYKKRMYRNIIWLLIAFIPYFIVGFFPNHKHMINIMVILVILMIQGFSILNNNYLKGGIIFLIFIFWLIGFQVETNSAWGPGFEVKFKSAHLTNNANYNPDKSIQINKINLEVGSGMAMPTLEGPRPLFGFGEVFINTWYSFVNAHNDERNQAVLVAQHNNYRILQDVMHSFIYTKLLELDFKTDHEHNRLMNGFYEREFNKDNKTIVVNVVKNKNYLFNDNIINEYLLKNKRIVVYSKYSNIILKLKAKYKDKFEPKGGFWGVLSE